MHGWKDLYCFFFVSNCLFKKNNSNLNAKEVRRISSWFHHWKIPGELQSENVGGLCISELYLQISEIFRDSHININGSQSLKGLLRTPTNLQEKTKRSPNNFIITMVKWCQMNDQFDNLLGTLRDWRFAEIQAFYQAPKGWRGFKCLLRLKTSAQTSRDWPGSSQSIGGCHR